MMEIQAFDSRVEAFTTVRNCSLEAHCGLPWNRSTEARGSRILEDHGRVARMGQYLKKQGWQTQTSRKPLNKEKPSVLSQGAKKDIIKK